MVALITPNVDWNNVIYTITSRAVTNPKKNSDPNPNPNEFFCRISDPDPIIHKIYIKHNKTC